jgi:hypothetical protein
MRLQKQCFDPLPRRRKTDLSTAQEAADAQAEAERHERLAQEYSAKKAAARQ